MSTVLIVGASRGIGLETVRLALKAGHSVRALARSATSIHLHDPRLEKLDSDALDRGTVERALEGVHAVIQTLGVSPNPELIFSGTRLFSDATRILVDAMEAKAAKRLICVTGLGAGDSRGHGGLLYNAVLWLIKDLSETGEKLEAGDLLSLGTFSAPKPPPAGQTVTVRYEGLPGGPIKASVKFGK